MKGEHADSIPPDNVPRRSYCAPTTLGYSWTRAISKFDTFLYSRFLGCGSRIRYFKYVFPMIQKQPRYRKAGIPDLVTYIYPDAKSFAQTRKWVDDVRGERGNDVIIVLVGNKTDLNEKREVTSAQGEEEAKKNNLMFIETSAKAGHNVKQLFKRIAQALPGMEQEGGQAAQNQFIDVSVDPGKPKEESSCSC